MHTTTGADPARLINAQTFLDPYANFRRLREEDPMHWIPEFGVWFLSRYEDIVAVLKVAQRGARSRVILRDNSLYQTLTRPQTLRRQAQGGVQGRPWRKQA